MKINQKYIVSMLITILCLGIFSTNISLASVIETSYPYATLDFEPGDGNATTEARIRFFDDDVTSNSNARQTDILDALRSYYELEGITPPSTLQGIFNEYPKSDSWDDLSKRNRGDADGLVYNGEIFTPYIMITDQAGNSVMYSNQSVFLQNSWIQKDKYYQQRYYESNNTYKALEEVISAELGTILIDSKDGNIEETEIFGLVVSDRNGTMNDLLKILEYAELCKNGNGGLKITYGLKGNKGSEFLLKSDVMPIHNGNGGYVADDEFHVLTGLSLDHFEYSMEQAQDYADNVGGDMFEQLEKAIAAMIRGLANFVYNVVMLGIRATGGNSSELVTIDDLVFDEFPDTSLNVFYDGGDNTSLVSRFKSTVMDWFNNFQGIALMVYLVLLLYVGLRILISVGGKQQSRYKEMLLAWGQGLVLLIIFPIAIKYAIQLNHAIVQTIKDSRFEAFAKIGVNVNANNMDNTSVPDVQDLTASNGTEVGKSIVSNPFKGHMNDNYMAYMACTAEDDERLVDAIVYAIMVFQFVMLLVQYYKRLMNFAFLITIYPIVMIMYPIDKVGDGRAQSFSTWSTELMMNIFMQVFHAIVYVFVIGVVYSAQLSGSWLLAIVGITFLFKGEELLRSVLQPGESQTAPTMKQSAGKTIAAFTVMATLTDKLTDNIGHATSAVRFARKARAEKNYANAIRKSGGRIGGAGGTGATGGTTPGGGSDSSGGSDQTINVTTPQPQIKTAANKALAGTGLTADDVTKSVAVLKGVKDNKNPEEIAKALKNLQKAVSVNDPAVNKLLQGSGLSAKQVEELSKLQKQAMDTALKGDKTKGNYSKTLEKINKDLEIGLSAIFPNLSTADKKKFKQAMIFNMKDRSQVALGIGASDPAFRTISSERLGKTGIEQEVQGARSRANAFLDVDKTAERYRGKAGELFALSKGKIKLSKNARREEAIMRAELGSTVYLNSAGHAITESEAARIRRSGGVVSTRQGKYYEKAKDWSADSKDKFAENYAIASEFRRRAQGDTTATAYTLEQVNDAFTGLAELEDRKEIRGEVAGILKTEFGVSGKEGQLLFDETVGATLTDTGLDATEDLHLPVGERQFRKVLKSAMDLEERKKPRGKKIVRKAVNAVKDYGEVDHEETDIERGVKSAFNAEAFNGTAPSGQSAEDTEKALDNTQKAYKKVMARVVTRDNKRMFQSAKGKKPGAGGISVSTPGGPSGPAPAPDSEEPFEYYEDSTMNTSIAQVLYNDREGISDADYAAIMSQERRDVISTVMEDLQAGSMKEDSAYVGATIDDSGHYIPDTSYTINNMTADEHEAKAKEYRRRMFEEAARTVTTSSSALMGATMGAPLGIGIGAEDSMLKEALVGAVGGATIGDTLAERTFGEQKSITKLRVRNPYDGTITEIDVQRTGFDANPLGILGESAVNLIDPDKVYEVSDLPRLLPESTRLNVDAQLADSARKRRKKIEEDEAKNRVNLYRDNLLSSKKDKNK